MTRFVAILALLLLAGCGAPTAPAPKGDLVAVCNDSTARKYPTRVYRGENGKLFAYLNGWTGFVTEDPAEACKLVDAYFK